MKYYNWYSRCPYWEHFSSPYSYQGLFHEGEQALVEDSREDLYRAQRDIERVIGIVQQSLSNEISQIVSLGMNRNLLDYLIREIVDYLDKNIDRYKYSMSNNITTASDEIKYRLYWIFNIMRIFGVPFEQQVRLLDRIVIIAFQNLRPAANVQGQMQR